MNSAQSQTQDALQAFNETEAVFQSGLEPFEGLFGATMVEQLTNYESWSFSSMLGSWNVDGTGTLEKAPE